MIKKSLTLIILCALSLFFMTSISARAATVTFSVFDERPGSFFYSGAFSNKPWEGTRGSSIQKDHIYIDEAYIDYEIEVNTMMTINSVNRQIIQRTNAKTSSRIHIYEGNYYQNFVKGYYMSYVNGDLTKMRAYDENGQEFNPLNYKGHYMQVILAISDGILRDDYNTMVDILKANPKDYLTLNFTMNAIEVDPDNPTQLPDTVGSIFNDSSRVGRVTPTVDGRNVNFRILYEGSVYNLDYTFANTTDMTIFDRAYEIYYFTYNNVKYMLFNHGDESMFTRSSRDTFIPYTLWNMETNELTSFERYNVYIYLRKEAAMSVSAYFYVDQFVIDNLISATLSMEFRYINILGVKLGWNPYMKVLENANITSTQVSWKAIAASISTVATTIGGMSGVGWPLFLVGTAVSAYLSVKTYEELASTGWLKLGGTNEIKAVQPGATLLGEINKAYAAKYEDFNPITANQKYKIFKLDMGSFDRFFMDKIEVKDSSFNLASFTYVTNGNMYVEVAGEDYDVIVNPGELIETPDTNPNFAQQIMDFFNTWLTTIIIIASIFAGGFMLFWISKSSSSIWDLFSHPGKLIIFGVIVLGVLKVLKVI